MAEFFDVMFGILVSAREEGREFG
jgi:hypothetical protein